jgi:hypothetical protein
MVGINARTRDAILNGVVYSLKRSSECDKIFFVKY